MNLVSGKLTSKGQLTIPVELRNTLRIEEGDRLEFILDENGEIIGVKPVKKKKLSDALGHVKVDKLFDISEIRDEVYRLNSIEKMSKDEVTNEG